jgi:ankyrin repeat protein
MKEVKFLIIFMIFFSNCSNICTIEPKELIEKSNIDTFKKTIENGYNIDCQDKEGYTALHYAVINNKVDIAEYLLKKRCDVNIKNSYGLLPLYYALENDNLQIIKMLISYGSKTIFGNWFLSNNRSALYYAKSLSALSYLHKAGLDINYGCNKTETALHSAVKQHNFEMVNYLIKNGAIIDCKWGNEVTPLRNICTIDVVKGKEKERLRIIELLIKNGANVNNKNHSGYSILDNAVDFDTDKLLFKYGAKLNKVVKENIRPGTVH